MTVEYEWDVETVADGDSTNFEDGEVIEHYHCVTCAEALTRAAEPAEQGFRHEVVLVRDDDEGRSWAYVTQNELPRFFTDADGADSSVVPQRFHQALERALRTTATS